MVRNKLLYGVAHAHEEQRRAARIIRKSFNSVSEESLRLRVRESIEFVEYYDDKRIFARPVEQVPHGVWSDVARNDQRLLSASKADTGSHGKAFR
jgi:hypothetical protein